MGTMINTNVSSLVAQGSLKANDVKLSTAMQRLSTGLRINSAADDAAGLAIGNRMTTDIRGFAAAVKNANDGISLLQTAEGSLASVTDSLQRIRELAVQAASDSYSASDRSSLNGEASQMVNEIDRVATNSKFNNVAILDGTYVSKTIQLGAYNSAADQLSVSLGSARSTALGVGTGSSYATSVQGATIALGAGTALASNVMTINGFNVGAALSDGVSNIGNTTSGIAVANAINAVSAQSKVSATVGPSTLAGTAATVFTAVTNAASFKINGVNLGALAAVTDAVSRGNQVSGAINAITAQTGVTATFNTTTGAVALTAADGRNITISVIGVASPGIDAKATLGVGTAAMNGGTVVGTYTDFTTRSAVKLSSTDGAGIAIGGNATAVTAATGLTAAYTVATATPGTAVSSLDLTSVLGAQNAISTIDQAIGQVNTLRATLGAYSNRLNSAVSNLQIGGQNLSAARSRVMDTDYAVETTSLARSQIIAQAATAMLAQANQSSQTVLALLK